MGNRDKISQLPCATLSLRFTEEKAQAVAALQSVREELQQKNQEIFD
jgi:hypothetical protein